MRGIIPSCLSPLSGRIRSTGESIEVLNVMEYMPYLKPPNQLPTRKAAV